MSGDGPDPGFENEVAQPGSLPPIPTGKEQFLTLLESLANYVDEGIRDYLGDNGVEDYMDHGDFDGDLENLRAVRRIRAFVTTDDYPWWEMF